MESIFSSPLFVSTFISIASLVLISVIVLLVVVENQRLILVGEEAAR